MMRDENGHYGIPTDTFPSSFSILRFLRPVTMQACRLLLGSSPPPPSSSSSPLPATGHTPGTAFFPTSKPGVAAATIVGPLSVRVSTVNAPQVVSTATSVATADVVVGGTTTLTPPLPTLPTLPPVVVPEIHDDEVSTDTPSKAFRDYQSLFLSQRREAPQPIPLRCVEGAVPAQFPTGTYYLAGPGLFNDDHGSTVHPLDGHGYLRAFEFVPGGSVSYSARYIDTAAAQEERDDETGSWRFTHRGPFSVLAGGKKLGNVKVMKNVANTSVLSWGGKLLCLWEGGDPYELDPRTMETIGPLDVFALADREADRGNALLREKQNRRAGGRNAPAAAVKDAGVDVAAWALKPVLNGVFKMPAKRLLSHYKIDAKRERLLVVSCNAEDMLLPRSNFTFYEFDKSFNLVHRRDFSLPDHLMIHDWAFTDGHYVIIANRIKLDIAGSVMAASGFTPMISALAVNSGGPATTPTYLLPRFNEGRRDWKVPIEAPGRMWALHVGNAYETTDAVGNTEIALTATTCSYHWFDFQRMFGYDWKTGKLDPSFMNAGEEGNKHLLPHLVEMTIRMDNHGTTCLGCSVRDAARGWRSPADFPAINPAFSGRHNEYTYAATTSGTRRFLPHFPFDSVSKIRTSDCAVATWRAGPRRFVGEPVFLPREGRGDGQEEDDGYVMVVEYAVAMQRCYLVILDAKRIGSADAVVAKLEVPKHLTFPMAFHGFWAAN